jgi:hypothetical protein
LIRKLWQAITIPGIVLGSRIACPCACDIESSAMISDMELQVGRRDIQCHRHGGRGHQGTMGMANGVRESFNQRRLGLDPEQGIQANWAVSIEPVEQALGCFKPAGKAGFAGAVGEGSGHHSGCP